MVGQDSSLNVEPHMARRVAVRLTVFFTGHAMAMSAIALNAMAIMQTQDSTRWMAKGGGGGYLRSRSGLAGELK